MSAGQLFVRASSQNNAINQQFINDIKRIKARGFGPLALQLLNQGDAEAMKVAHSLATGSIGDLKAAAANLTRSGSLQSQIDAIKAQLSGTSAAAAAAAVTARREANAQTMAWQYAAAQSRYGTTVINHSGGVDHDKIGQAIVTYLRQEPLVAVGTVNMDSVAVGRMTAGPVSWEQKKRDSYGYTGIYAGQGDY